MLPEGFMIKWLKSAISGLNRDKLLVAEAYITCVFPLSLLIITDKTSILDSRM